MARSTQMVRDVKVLSNKAKTEIADLQKFVENIKNNNAKIISEYDDKIIINDPNGIEIHLIKEI